jgi:hypothetical protein
MVTAGAVSCALPGPIGPVAGSRAASHPSGPELARIAERTRRPAAGLQNRCAQMNPNCAQNPNEPEPHRCQTNPTSPQQASSRCARTNPPCVHSERTQGSGESERTQALAGMKLAPHERTQGALENPNEPEPRRSSSGNEAGAPRTNPTGISLRVVPRFDIAGACMT